MDFLQFLIKEKALGKQDAAELKEVISGEKLSLEEAILERKIIEEIKLFQLKSAFLHVPLLEALPEEIPSEIFSVVPRESVDFYRMAPLSIDKKEMLLTVAMVYPENTQAQEALKFLARQQKLIPKVFLITFSDFKRYLGKYKEPKIEVEKALESLEQEISKGDLPENLIANKARFERLVEEAPIIKMVAVILRQAVEGNASDIHIEPTREITKVRYRLDGILYSSLTLPLKAHQAVVARIKILSNLKIDETRMPQDGRFATKVGEKMIDFRVSTFPTILGEKVVLRVLSPDEGMSTLDALGFSGYNLEKTKEAIQSPYGMVLVTGPTGSGKTTTLYAVLKLLKSDGVNIVTLEDPVEYFIDGVSQSQVKPEIDYTFARGLRQILRQDPDIIMVGEIRDEETANLAVHAALTGHLVLSTLHTNNAPGAIPRLVDMGIKPFLIPASLVLVMSQRLVRKLCPECRKKVKATEEMKKYILDKTKDMPKSSKDQVKEPFFVYKPGGCKKCNSKGYSGRVGIFEVMSMTDEVSQIVYTAANELDIFKEARKQGMATMVEDGILKALNGITSLEEVMSAAEMI